MAVEKQSIFAHVIENEDEIILYNSVYKKPVYWNKEKYTRYLSRKCDITELEDLYEIHFLIRNKCEDARIIETSQQFFCNTHEYIDLIYINLSNQCNLCCDYCLVESNKKNAYLEKRSFDNFYEKLEKYIEKNKLQVKFILYGGEPTLAMPILKYVVDKVSKINSATIGIVTNGTLLTEDVINYLKSQRIYINISLDGPQELNDKHRKFIRKANSVYDATFTSLSILKEKYLEDLYAISLTITPEVLECKEDVFKWLKEVKVNNVVYNILKNTDIVLEKEDYYTEVARFMQESYERLHCIGIKEGTTEQLISSARHSGIRLSNCAAMAGTELVLDSDGELYSCHGTCDSQTKFACQVGEHFGKKASKLLPIYREKCWKCRAFAICGGKCYYINTAELFCGYMQSMADWAMQIVWNK